MRTNELTMLPQIEMTFEPKETQAFMRLFNDLNYPDVENIITAHEYQLLNQAWLDMWNVLDRVGIDKDVYFGDE